MEDNPSLWLKKQILREIKLLAQDQLTNKLQNQDWKPGLFDFKDSSFHYAVLIKIYCHKNIFQLLNLFNHLINVYLC